MQRKNPNSFDATSPAVLSDPTQDKHKRRKTDSPQTVPQANSVQPNFQTQFNKNNPDDDDEKIEEETLISSASQNFLQGYIEGYPETSTTTTTTTSSSQVDLSAIHNLLNANFITSQNQNGASITTAFLPTDSTNFSSDPKLVEGLKFFWAQSLYLQEQVLILKKSIQSRESQLSDSKKIVSMLEKQNTTLIKEVKKLTTENNKLKKNQLPPQPKNLSQQQGSNTIVNSNEQSNTPLAPPKIKPKPIGRRGCVLKVPVVIPASPITHQQEGLINSENNTVPPANSGEVLPPLQNITSPPNHKHALPEGGLPGPSELWDKNVAKNNPTQTWASLFGNKNAQTSQNPNFNFKPPKPGSNF